MAAKKIQVSDDGGTTYYTLPGSTGERRVEMAAVNDTIFGQDYTSEDASIGSWTVTANSFYKGVAGYAAKLQQGGTPTAMTAEAAALVTGKTYQITNTAKRFIDYSSPLTVFDGGVDHTADVASVDYLNGTVTFKGTYTPTGAITLTGMYVPLVTLAKGRTFGLTQTAAEIDETVYENAQANGGWRELGYGLKTVRLEVGSLFDVTATPALRTALQGRGMMLVSVDPKGDGNALFRGFFKRMNIGNTGDVGALEDQTIGLNLYVPDGTLVERPFGWYLSNTTTMNLAVRKVLNAWQNSLPIYVRYMPDGVNGEVGQAIVTEAGLNNTFEGLNEFRFTFRGDGVLASYP
jgi:hypothetical protein